MDCRRRRMHLFLLWLTAGICIRGAEGEVSWFLHVSDLHLSKLFPDREADLHRLLKDVLSEFHFSSVLFTGDLVEARKNRWRSAQKIKEWEGYQRMTSTVHTSLGLSNETFLDIRGNHDTFDVPVRNGERDFYRFYGEQGENWSTTKILFRPIDAGGVCPKYILIGVDLSPDIGLRSPLNFFGRANDRIVTEFESVATGIMRDVYRNDCDPILLAYGHYPLSMTATASYFLTREDNALRNVLLKYGIDAWLCGHLHSVFGKHLFRLHGGQASTLLELETMDWKLERRFRILAVDDGHLSYVDLQIKDRKPKIPSIEAVDDAVVVDGSIVLITSPASLYFSPLGNRGRSIDSTVNEVRALVWPVQTKKEDIIVSAEFYCGRTTERSIRLTPIDDGPLYKGRLSASVDESFCKEDAFSVRVKATVRDTNQMSYSERRRIRSRDAPEDFSHSLIERLALGLPWYSIFQNLSTMLFLSHVLFLLILPRTLSYFKVFRSKPVSLDDGSDDRRYRYRSVFLAPIRGMELATRYPTFLWGQMSFVLLMIFGPWFFARSLSNKPLSIIFLSTVYAQPDDQIRSVFAPEMTLRACFYYAGVVFPMTLWTAWSLNRSTEKGKGSCKYRKLLTVGYIFSGLFCLMAFGHTAFGTWHYYGPLAFFLSPSLMGWLVLNLVTILTAARFSGPKFRQE